MEIHEKNHDMLAFRLADMLRRFNQGERLSVMELAALYGVDARTIQRDVNQRFAYLPLKKEGKKYFLDGFYLGKLNEQDIRHFAALAGVAGIFPSLDHRFLRNILDSTTSSAYQVKSWPVEDVQPYQHTMESLQQAIVARRWVRFAYHQQTRLLQPYKLIHHHGRWYVAAQEQGASHPKSFRLAKLSHLEVLAEVFCPDTAVLAQIEAEPSIWFGEKMEIVLTVAREVAGRFLDRELVPEQQIVKELADGGLIISSKVVNQQQILPIIRYWVPHVKVVSPDSVREAYLTSLRQHLQMFA